ncbi:MobA/MobL family protein, partial [Streptococcus suis]
THIVADLPMAEPERWTWLVETYAYRHLVDKGMIADWSIHGRKVADGAWTGQPHVHILATARFWRPNGRVGSHQWQWLANADQIRAAEDGWLRLTGLR